jgi:hypothetical protein
LKMREMSIREEGKAMAASVAVCDEEASAV